MRGTGTGADNWQPACAAGAERAKNVPQEQQGETGVGELQGSPTGEPFKAPAYSSPLSTRAPQGFLPDPRCTLDHAGQARFFEPSFQQWQAQMQHQQAQVHQQWDLQAQHPEWGLNTSAQQWGLQFMPQQASPTQDQRGLASEEPSQAQQTFFGDYQGPTGRQEHYSCPPHSTRSVDGQHSSSPGQLFPAFAGQAAPQQAVAKLMRSLQTMSQGLHATPTTAAPPQTRRQTRHQAAAETLQAARGSRRRSRSQSPRPSRG